MLKKSFLLLIVCVGVLGTCKQPANAQLRYGAGIFYGTWLNNPGLTARAELAITEGLAVVPKIEISIPRMNTGTFLNALAVHLHYSIDVTEGIAVYPLAGVTLKSYLDIDRSGSSRVNHRFGLNPALGAGGKLKITDSFAVFADGRYDIGRYHQFVSTIGILMTPRG